MRFPALVPVVFFALSAPVSAAVMQATYTGMVWDVFYVFEGGDRGTEQDCPPARRAAGVLCDATGLDGRAFTVDFIYDSETMARSQFPNPENPLQDSLRAGPSQGLPVGEHSATLSIDCAYCPVLTPQILGNQFFTAQIITPLVQHTAFDQNPDGHEAFIEILFGAEAFAPPTDILAEFDFTRVGIFPPNGLFSFKFPGGGGDPAFEFIGQLEILSVSVAIVPLPAGAWLMLGAFGALAALRRRAAA